MFLKRLKVLLAYVSIVFAGLALGYVAVNLPAWMKPDYTEGDYRAYFPDSTTRVVVYGTKQCPYCAMTRDFLKASDIAFADLDIDTTGKAKAEFSQLGGSGVPLILIGNRRIEGFNKPVIEASLAKLGIHVAVK